MKNKRGAEIDILFMGHNTDNWRLWVFESVFESFRWDECAFI